MFKKSNYINPLRPRWNSSHFQKHDFQMYFMSQISISFNYVPQGLIRTKLPLMHLGGLVLSGNKFLPRFIMAYGIIGEQLLNMPIVPENYVCKGLNFP